MTRMPWLAAAALAAACLSVPVHAADAPLVADKPIVIPGGPGGGFDWVTVDGGQRQALVAHKKAGLTVVNLDDGTTKTIPTGEAMGAAVDATDNKIFVGVSAEKMVVVLDRKTLEKKNEIKVDGPCDALIMCRKNGMLYVCNDDGKAVWVIDPKTDKIVGSVTIPEGPEALLYDRQTERIYLNIKSDDTVQVIDPTTNKVEKSWSTKPATGPHGLAYDRRSQRLFSGGKNGKLAVIDMKTGAVTSTVDIEKGVDQIAYDATMKRLYCACSGFISVVEVTDDGAKLLANVEAPKGAHTLAIDPKTHAVWTCYADKDSAYLLKFTAPGAPAPTANPAR